MVIAEAVGNNTRVLLHDQPKVWFISGVSPHVWGGGLEEAVSVVSKEFAGKGVKVSIFHGITYNRPQREETLPDNVSLTEIPLSKFADLKGFSLGRYLRFRHLIESARPDFVVVNMPGRIGIAAALALKDFSIPTTFWWHGTHILSSEESDYQYPPSLFRELARKFIFNPIKTTAVRRAVEASKFNHAACSEFTINILEDTGILSSGVAKVLNPPSETGLGELSLDNKPHLDGVEDNDLVVFIPTRVAPDKQFYNVREMIAGLQPTLGGKHKINFVLAGPPSSPEYLSYAFPKIDTGVLKTTYLGILDRKGMERVYSRADCVLMPNRAEMFGLATVEAMRFGLPVLGFKFGGTAEILGEFPDYPHYLIPERRGQITIDPVKDFLEGAQAKRSAGLNQRDRILERFDPQRLSDQVLKFVTQTFSEA